MRIDVLKSLRLQMVLTVAVVGLVGLAAGCSSDTARFDDGFYTGAVPKAPLGQAAASQPYPGSATRQGYPGSVDATTTGSVSQPQGGGYGQYRAQTGTVQSGQLPPPPPPSYGQGQSGYGRSAQAAPSRSYGVGQTGQSSQSGVRTASTGYGNAGPVTRGAPPTTLQAQASHISTPQSRPTYAGSSPTAASSSSRSANAAQVKVESGDTLLGIARRTGVSTAEIKRANGMSDDTVRLGQTLSIPGARAGSTRVASLETKAASVATSKTEAAKKTPEPYTPPKSAESAPVAASMAEKSSRPTADAPSAPVQASASTSVGNEVKRDVASIAPDSTGIDGFRWPVQGRVVNRFGEKVGSRRNDGLNISVPRGTPVKAAENGVVIYAGDGLKEFGNTVLIKHDDGLVTVYGHAETLEVQKGTKVKRGQEIAKSGMSGDTDVPLLHFEVRKNSSPVDPTKYLQ